MNIPSSLLLLVCLVGNISCKKAEGGGGLNVESFNRRGIMMYGDTALGGEPFAKDPSVVKFKGKYWMYYSVPTHDGNNGWKIGIASSQDMLQWKKEAQMESEHPSEAKGFCAPITDCP